MTDDLKNKPPPDICYHVKFGSSPSKGLCINIKEHTKLGSAGTPPPWSRRLADPLKIKPTPHMCYHIKFGSSAAKGVCINRMESKKIEERWNPALLR